MRVYSFQIEPKAEFRRRLRRTVKFHGRFALERFLGLFLPGSRPESAKNMSRISKRSPKNPNAFQPDIAAPAGQIIAARQTRYGIYAVSTSQWADGRWVASFGRRDGKPVCIDGKSLPVATTGPYFAEALAIANARTVLDALAATDAAAGLT